MKLQNDKELEIFMSGFRMGYNSCFEMFRLSFNDNLKLIEDSDIADKIQAELKVQIERTATNQEKK